MNNKKSTILVAALSLSFVLSTQSVLAVEDQAGQAGYVSETDSSGKSADTDLIFTIDQQIKLSSAGYSPEEIIALDKKARDEKAALGQDFDLVKFVKDKIEEKKREKENTGLEISDPVANDRVGSPNGEDRGAVDASSSATYYKKANWENKIKDKSRWKVEDNQRLVRVTTSEPVQMNDIDYDGNFVDANGRTVLRLVYKEKGGAATGVWYRARFNFGELDQYIDYDKSYMVGLSVAGNESGTYPLTPVKGLKDREVDLGRARGDLTNQRKNLPINLVLKEGVTIEKLGQKNYIVQMRLTDTNGERIYAYAPGKTSMDYSTYTKTTSVSLEDKVNRLFIKGGYQSDSNNATAQEFVTSEFIANPEQYSDKSNLGIIRTQYTGQTNTIVRETVGDQPIAFTQVFDANLVKYMKADGKGNVAYVNVLTNGRVLSPVTKNVGIPKEKINYSKDGKLAYIVIGTKAFKKDGVKVVTVPKLDQHVMLSGFYITAIDYVVDKGEFENTFAGKTQGIDKTRKLNYSMISGWTNPNTDGWTIYEKTYDSGYVAKEGESYLIDTTSMPEGGQIMIQFGDDDAIIRKQQGYYSYYITSGKGIEKIEEYAKGVFKFDLREGATVKAGDKLRVFMPYTKDHKDPVNFLEINNATKRNEGAATLTLNKDRNITVHMFKEGKKGHFVLKYTLADGTKSSMEFTPKVLWKYSDKDRILTGVPNTSADGAGGNFYINTKKLKPGADIFVESYDENGNKLENQTSWFKYRALTKAQDTVKELTWTDHSDKSSILSINKSLYTPYQLIFTNDIAKGEDDTYKDPRAFSGDNGAFNKDTKEIVGYTKYDGGKIRTLYEEGRTGKFIAKVEAEANEYDDKGNLKGDDVRKDITIKKDNIFDPQFDGDNKIYKAYQYRVNLAKMLAYHSDDDKTEHELKLLKDMKFVSTASDGSSLPSDLYETRVRTRVLFDTTEGAWDDNTKKSVKIVPDNVKFYGEEGYVANGFEGANVEANTGDKFPENPKLAGKNFLGWVTEAGKQALGNKAVVTADEFNKLPKEQIFTNETPITKHLVVYAVYSDELTVTFDANQGKFTDGKDTTNVKVKGGSVTKPADPTRDGFTFKGWAADKNATEADANILNNITAPKTVYAVWEKKDKDPLTLNNPEKVEVKDTKSLTSDEIDKVKKAVAEANKDKGITESDVTVAKDGTVTVTKDGKTGTLNPEKTIKQKEVKNEFNPPEKPVPVDKIGELKPDEIAAIKKAVKDANPDRNFKDEDITVEADGTVKINQGGKVGTISADKTVVQKDTILDLTAPEKTEVKDTTNLTQAERDKVAEAVKKANEGKLSADAVVTVDNKGNVTVKDGTKNGTLEGKDTVKPFDRAGKTLNNPEITTVSNPAKLTDAEKQAVKDAVKKANPDLGFKDEEIKVADDGTVTVPMGTAGDKTIEAVKTVRQAGPSDNKIALKAPSKTEVADKSHLTDKEKKDVEDAVKEANPSLKDDGYKIVVSDDGAVTVTLGTEPNQKIGQLSQKDTVEEKLKAPTVEAVADGSVKVLPNNKESDTLEISFGDAANPTKVTANKDADGNWALADGTDPSIKIDKETGTVTIPASMLSKNEEVKATEKAGKQVSPEATANSNDTTAPEKPAVKVEDNGSVKVTPPTDADTKSVTIEYKDQDGNSQTLTATKGDDGNWTLPVGTDASITIDKTTGIVTLPKDKIKAGEKATATAKDANGNESAAGEATPVDKADLKAEVDKNNNDAIKNSDKYKKADQTKKDAYDTALDKAKKVLEDPDAKQKDVNEALQQLKEAEKALDGTVKPADELNDPAKVTVKDPANLTDDEKKAIKDAVKKANPGLTDDQIAVDKEGNVTVTKPGEEPKTIGKDKTVSTDVKAPAITEVANKSKLSSDEKTKVKEAVKTANAGLTDDQIEVKDDGTVVVTKDGKETTIPASDVVKQKATPGAALKDPAKVAVKDPANLTDDEKKAIKDA
ncbi:InlB B-repeat-containing protein, partial [Anaerococcus lactolyticus]|uniref:InlB B-repeat-containing protein n=1 Tax=Anaerococcus lactolyticus TaxID=33032 RepID=UPI00288ABF7B